MRPWRLASAPSSLQGWRGGLLGIAAALIAWGWLVRNTTPAIPSLPELSSALLDLLASGELARSAMVSCLRVLTGLGVSLAIVAALAALTALMPAAVTVLNGPLELLRPVPPIAWVPVAIVTFGIGDAPAIAIIALGTFFPLWIAVQHGFREVARQHLQAARSLGAGRRTLLIEVLLPSIAPAFAQGLRTAVGIGWFCVVAAEMMGVTEGLGYGVQIASLNIRTERTYCYLLAIGFLGALISAGVDRALQRVVWWTNERR